MTTPASQPANIGVIACGAIARELVALIRLNQWQGIKLHCLPADLHNRPEKIPDQVRAKIIELQARYPRLFVAYADCGTGGLLDTVINEFGVERLPGAHCYEFFSSNPVFSRWMEDNPGTLFLTDFLVRHGQRLLIQALGLDRFPQLRDSYFGHYQTLLYIAQTEDPALQQMAQAFAIRLQLEYQYHYTGLAHFHDSLHTAKAIQWQS